MSNNFEQKIYEEHFEKTYRFLKNSLSENIEKEIAILNSTIETMLTHQGNDWIGRGDISLAKSNASIAAAEVLKSELEEKLKSKNS